jgi:hypothetical protein
MAFKSQCRQIAGDLFIFKCPCVHLCRPVFSLLAVKLHLLGQGHLVELIKVKYLKSKTLTRKQYVIFVIPVTTSTSLPTKKKGYLTSFKWSNFKPSTKTNYSWLT